MRTERKRRSIRCSRGEPETSRGWKNRANVVADTFESE
jgi:hypothetical protein